MKVVPPGAGSHADGANQTRRHRQRRASLTSAVAFVAVATFLGTAPGEATTDSTLTSGRVPSAWVTPAERTAYRTTPTYDETMAYLHRLEQASRWIRVTSYGKSGQGRDLPLVIVSKRRAFTPNAARSHDDPIVLVQNGIHSGEIEGKDACLALLRDMLVLRRHDDLLDHVTLLVLPIFSVDAHERRSPTNRINQNGPEEMGWRTTPIGLNLNRDYMKAEAPEMRAMLREVFTHWWPHLFVDTHTTDGADYQYDLTYAYAHSAGTPAPLDRWLQEAFAGRVIPQLEARGHLTAPYIAFRGWVDDPRVGIDMGNAPPRFSTGYTPLHGRPGILIETHMLKPYGTRVLATYDVLLALLEEVNARPRQLQDAVVQAESIAVRRGRGASPVSRTLVLDTDTTERSEPFQYRGFAARREWSDILGAPVPRYTKTVWDTIIPIFREVVPTLTVTQPIGYLVPQEWTAVRERLDTHGVRYHRFVRAWSDTVEVQRVVAWDTEMKLREGHRPTRVDSVVLERRLRHYQPGDLWVPLDQPSAPVAVHLFEALAPDGMMYWNFFDTVLERKEYAETYVMEPLAGQMLQADPALAREFHERLRGDSTFAASPEARNDFFYRRSRWADPEHALHPVTRALRPPPPPVLGKVVGASR